MEDTTQCTNLHLLLINAPPPPIFDQIFDQVFDQGFGIRKYSVQFHWDGEIQCTVLLGQKIQCTVLLGQKIQERELY